MPAQNLNRFHHLVYQPLSDILCHGDIPEGCAGGSCAVSTKGGASIKEPNVLVTGAFMVAAVAVNGLAAIPHIPDAVTTLSKRVDLLTVERLLPREPSALKTLGKMLPPDVLDEKLAKEALRVIPHFPLKKLSRAIRSGVRKNAAKL